MVTMKTAIASPFDEIIPMALCRAFFGGDLVSSGWRFERITSGRGPFRDDAPGAASAHLNPWEYTRVDKLLTTLQGGSWLYRGPGRRNVGC